MAWNVNGLFRRYTSSMSAAFLSHSRGRSYHQPSRSMTRAWRGFARRSKGSFITRSVAKVWVAPPCKMGSRRETRDSKTAGQSSSAPSSRPIRCRLSDKARQMMSDLRAPRRPVVRDIVAPEVELVGDALLGEEPGEAARRLERTR